MDWAKRLRIAKAISNMHLEGFGALCAKQPGGDALAPSTWGLLTTLVQAEWVVPGPRAVGVFEAALGVLEREGQDG